MIFWKIISRQSDILFNRKKCESPQVYKTGFLGIGNKDEYLFNCTFLKRYEKAKIFFLPRK